MIENYLKYGPDFGITFVNAGEPYDLKVAHAGVTGTDCDVAILHGIYFTGDYDAPKHEMIVNKQIVEAVRSAQVITVPSSWVSETFTRDMHISPVVVPHGIDASQWDHNYKYDQYVLYNKGRDGMDVCDSSQLDQLASIAMNVNFISTFSKSNPENVNVIGVLPHAKMKEYIQRAGVYLSVTKETFGIGTLEAMASGVPVLGWKHGGNVDLVDHGISGYLAEPGNYDDLLRGLNYIIKYRKVLGSNAKVKALDWSWPNAVKKLRDALDLALERKNRQPTVSVIIPTYNYAHKIGRCIESVRNQSLKPAEIIIVDDGSKDNTKEVVTELSTIPGNENILYYYKNNSGVADTRNLGGKVSTSKYLCFLDADDAIEPDFLKECVNALEKDSSLYCAYTTLKWIKPDGSTGISEWPGQWNYDQQIKRKNQVPTCNVMRREMFERTGGYRSRYAPRGAGSEDADLWTRAGALGMSFRKVSERPLFFYSWMSGNTSASDYREIDWLGWNGFIKTGQHPFASCASPLQISHKVYQYDEPVVSVIIPVGPGHEKTLCDAIDSVEGQTIKKWEVIVVNDSGKEMDLSPWPFVRYFETEKPKSGPGRARNIGVDQSRGKFIVFLDADDWLAVDALEVMLANWSSNKSIIYTDYFGISTVDERDLSQFGNRVVDYDPKTKRTVMRHKSVNYDCELAQAQPTEHLFHWCTVTCLIPKAWHIEIGGFDESMQSWEDVDYHWRMARAGKCYSRVDEPLMYYRFDTGNRRTKAEPDKNLDVAVELLSYMKHKYEGVEKMPCVSCGGNRSVKNTVDMSLKSSSASAGNDKEFVLALYNHPNRGDHMVVGPSTGINYGYRCGGDKFLVHVNDKAAMPHIFVDVKELEYVSANEAPKPPEIQIAPPVALEPPSPSITDEKFDLQMIPGITQGIADQLTEMGVVSKKELLELSVDDIKSVKGVGEVRAKAIFGSIQKMKEKDG